jgi:hypothetical protein
MDPEDPTDGLAPLPGDGSNGADASYNMLAAGEYDDNDDGEMLDADHPMLDRIQAALSKQLENNLARVRVELGNKVRASPQRSSSLHRPRAIQRTRR